MQTFAVIAVFILNIQCATASEESRRNLFVSRQYPLEVGEIYPNGKCEDNGKVFDALFIEASGYCSEALARVIPRPICRTTPDNRFCPPGHVPCKTFPSPYCAVDEQACRDTWFEQVMAIGNVIVNLVGKFATGGAATAFEYVGKTFDVMTELKGLTDLDLNTQAFQQFVESKKGIRAVFGRTWSALHMQIAQHDFFTNRKSHPENFDPAWDTLSVSDQEMILAAACRNEADKALRFESEDQILRDLNAGKNKILEAKRRNPECFDINDSLSERERWNAGRDCASHMLNLIDYVDPIGIASVLESFNVETCTPTTEYPYMPRAELDIHHPWYRFSKTIGEQLSTIVDLANWNPPTHTDDRGNGESIMHQLRAKMLKSSCAGRPEIKYQKGVCRPFTDVSNFRDLAAIKENNPFTMVTRSEMLFHDSGENINGRLKPDMCCSKDGYTTVENEHECRDAHNRLYPNTAYQVLSNDKQMGGCNYDVVNEKIVFNRNMNLNNGVRGAYTPICKEGQNRFLDVFNVQQELENFQLGSNGNICARFEYVRYVQHCRYALTKLFGPNIPLVELPAFSRNLGCGVRYVNGRYEGVWNPSTQYSKAEENDIGFMPICYKHNVIHSRTTQTSKMAHSCCSIMFMWCDECPSGTFKRNTNVVNGQLMIDDDPEADLRAATNSGGNQATVQKCVSEGISGYGDEVCGTDPAAAWDYRRRRVCKCQFTFCRSELNDIEYDGMDMCIVKDITSPMDRTLRTPSGLVAPPSGPIPSGYVLMRQGCVFGMNIGVYKDKSVTECAALCNQNDDCISFEYGVFYGNYDSGLDPRDCQLNSSANFAECDGSKSNMHIEDCQLNTPANFEECHGSKSNMDLYIHYDRARATPSPTSAPTFSPSSSPSFSAPTFSPSSPADPSLSPSPAPTFSPSSSPTPAPTFSPSSSPSPAPTFSPSSSPSPAQTFAPSSPPTSAPTHSPSIKTTRDPSYDPTQSLTDATQIPTSTTNDPTLATQYPTEELFESQDLGSSTDTQESNAGRLMILTQLFILLILMF